MKQYDADILAAKARMVILQQMGWWAPTIGRLRSEVGPTRFGTAHTTYTMVRWDPRFATRMDGTPRTVQEFAWTWLHEVWHHVCGHVSIGDALLKEWKAEGLSEPALRHRMNLFGQAIDHVVNLALDDIIRESGMSGTLTEPKDLGICKDKRFARLSCQQVLAILMDENPDPPPDEGTQQGQGGGEGEGGVTAEEMGGGGVGSIGIDKPGDKDGKDDGSGDGKGEDSKATEGGAGPGDLDKLRQEWKESMIQSAMMGAKAGKLPGCMRGMVNEIAQAKVGWRSKLRDMFAPLIVSEQSFVRFNRRDDDLPGWEKDGCGVVAIVIDSSGSTWGVQKEFLGEIDSILVDVRPQTTYLIWADYDVHGEPEVYYAGERLDLERTQPRGGGGTSFAPAFKWIEEHGLRPEVLVYLTDLCGDFPKDKPPYPVIWCVYNLYMKGGELKVPFGEVIEVEPGA